MKNRKMTAMVFALALAVSSAGAETLSATGTVEAGITRNVYAPIGGTASQVFVEKGMTVQPGDTLVKLSGTKVYASEDGTVTGVFAQPGDDAERAAEIYGAILFLEGTTPYTVSASTSKAYSSAETTVVHAGEPVWLQCRNAVARVGTGIITGVDGSSYTVQVTEGNFIVGDSVYIYRDDAYTATLRLGQGSVSRVSPVAVTATGSVAKICVKDGDTVKKGDLLLETLDGIYDAYVYTGDEIHAEEAGVVSEVSATEGSAVSKGAAVVTIQPFSGMRVEAVVTADDLRDLKVGDPVTLEAEIDESRRYQGQVSWISALPEADTEEVSYRVYIDFTPDDFVTFGMQMEVIAGEDPETNPENEEDEAEEAEPETENPAAVPEPAAAPENTESRKPSGTTDRTEKPDRPSGSRKPSSFDGATRPDSETSATTAEQETDSTAAQE